MIKIIKISSYVDTLFFILGFKDKDKSFIDLKKNLRFTNNILQNECLKKLFQNLIFLFKKKKRKKRRIEIYQEGRISMKKHRCVIDTKSRVALYINCTCVRT